MCEEIPFKSVDFQKAQFKKLRHVKHKKHYGKTNINWLHQKDEWRKR